MRLHIDSRVRCIPAGVKAPEHCWDQCKCFKANILSGGRPQTPFHMNAAGLKVQVSQGKQETRCFLRGVQAMSMLLAKQLTWLLACSTKIQRCGRGQEPTRCRHPADGPGVCAAMGDQISRDCDLHAYHQLSSAPALLLCAVPLRVTHVRAAISHWQRPMYFGVARTQMHLAQIP